MRPLLAAALSLTLATPAAAMDSDVQWLFSHPLTRLDWVILSGKQRLTDMFVAKGGQSEIFTSDMARLGFDRPFTDVRYVLDRNQFQVFLSMNKNAAGATPDDCRKVLDHFRDDILLRGAGGARADLTNAPSRRTYAAGFMQNLTLGPSSVTSTDEPPQMGKRLMDLVRVEVLLFDPMMLGTFCSGTLAGDEVDLRMK